MRKTAAIIVASVLACTLAYASLRSISPTTQLITANGDGTGTFVTVTATSSPATGTYDGVYIEYTWSHNGTHSSAQMRTDVSWDGGSIWNNVQTSSGISVNSGTDTRYPTGVGTRTGQDLSLIQIRVRAADTTGGPDATSQVTAWTIYYEKPRGGAVRFM